MKFQQAFVQLLVGGHSLPGDSFHPAPLRVPLVTPEVHSPQAVYVRPDRRDGIKLGSSAPSLDRLALCEPVQASIGV